MRSHLPLAAASAFLGYTWNNTKGAYRGYKIGMAYGKRKRTIGRPSAARKRNTYSKAAKSNPAKGRRVLAAPRLSTLRKKPVAKYAVRKRRGGRRIRASAAAKVGGSAFSIGSGPKVYSGFKRRQLPTTFTSTITQRIAGGIGQQAVAALPTYRLNPGNIDPSNEPLRQSQCWIDSALLSRAELWLSANQNPGVGTSGTPAFNTSTHDSYRYTQKFVCNYLRYDQMIRNMSLQDVDIIIYDCVMRSGVQPIATDSVNGTIDPVYQWELGLSQELNPSDQQSTLAANNLKYQQSPGSTPFQSSAFCKLYKIKKVTKKTLSAGEVHHHMINIKPRNMWDAQSNPGPDRTTNITSRGPFIPGLSGFTLITGLGSIMGATGDVNAISTSTVALDVVTKGTGSFANFTRERRFHLRFDGLSKVGPLQGPQDDAGVITDDKVS